MKYRIKPTERNNQQCERIIEGTYQGLLVVCHDSEPYAVPMNHAYEDGRFYFRILGQLAAVRGDGPLRPVS